MKVIANRIAEVTPSLIAPDQVGFMKGRKAPDGTCRTLNIIRLAESKKKIPTTFLALDAEKAFDRMHWGYLQATLTKFGFRGFTLNYFSIIYEPICTGVYLFSIMMPLLSQNGTRQGYPSSPLIFSLVMEPFAESIGLPTMDVE